MERLSFYIVDSAYCDFLRKSDPCVPYTMDKKAHRPFVGIVLRVNGFSYYAPLSSPKQKHLKMKNQIDFIKIAGGKYGSINLNNMIPIEESLVTLVDPTIKDDDNKSDRAYKELLNNQLTWCNARKDNTANCALKLYNTVTSGKAYEKLVARCCNFQLDEQLLRAYLETKNV